MDHAAFSLLLTELRPALHRYCARMVGSVIDGEDVLQNALARATEAFATAPPLENPEGWVFRIAHNATLDFLRRRTRERGLLSSEETDAMIDPGPSVEARLALEASLRTFLRLPVSQRSSVLLMDVLGHSLEEIAAITGATVPAIKAALHRGRARLRTLAAEPDDAPAPVMSSSERVSLQAYVERFNAHDFDAIRDMLAEEVRLDLVARTRMNGKREVATYFHNYSGKSDWLLTPGLVEGHPAVLVLDPGKPDGAVLYFVLLGWSGGRLVTIRDFRHARYVMEAADAVRLAS
jgi:RNA polymerase sigma-70 factor (ECF subfamily)